MWARIADSVAILAKGVTLLLLWNWFVSDPLGIPALNLPEALGMTLIAVILTGRYEEWTADPEKFVDKAKDSIVFWIMAFIVISILGWIFHLFL